MKLIGISWLIGLSCSAYSFESIFNKLPNELNPTDYMFIVEISTQKNYLFYKKTMIDVFTVSTGSKQDTKGTEK